jgi:hypothetical protein
MAQVHFPVIVEKYTSFFLKYLIQQLLLCGLDLQTLSVNYSHFQLFPFQDLACIFVCRFAMIQGMHAPSITNDSFDVDFKINSNTPFNFGNLTILEI